MGIYLVNMLVTCSDERREENKIVWSQEITCRSELVNAGRPDFAFSYTYVTWKCRRVWELFLQKAPGRLLTRFTNCVENEITETMKQKPESRIIESCSQLKKVL